MSKGFEHPSKKGWLFIVLMAGALLPATSHAYPLIVATSAFALIPLVATGLATLFFNKRMMATCLMTVLAFGLFSINQDDLSGNNESENEVRRSYMDGEARRLVEDIRPEQPADMTRAMTYEQALQDGSRIVFVNPGSIRGQVGIDPYALLANPSYFNEHDILLSFDEYLARNLASVTKQRWVEGGVYGYLRQMSAMRGEVPREQSHPECHEDDCVLVGVFDSTTESIMTGFPYKKLAHSLFLEDLVLPGSNAASEIRRIAGHKRLAIAVFGNPSNYVADGVYHLLSDQGIQNLTVVRYGYDLVNAPKQGIKNEYASSVPTIEASNLSFLCENGLRLLVTIDFRGLANTAPLMPTGYRRCDIEVLPIEGLLPHQVKTFIQSYPFKSHSRYVGIYADKLSSFYALMAADFAKERGVNVIGLSATQYQYGRYAKVSMPVRQFVDGLYVDLHGQLESVTKGRANQVLLGLYLVVMLLLAMAFVKTHRRGVLMPLMAAQYLLLVFALFVCTFNTPQAVSHVLIGSLIISIAQVALVFRLQSISKGQGLKLMEALGLVTPRYRILSRIARERLEKIIREDRQTLIFRSNERSENQGGLSSGRYTSVVAHSADNVEEILGAWRAMEESGEASFVVQHYIDFDITGVVSSVTTEEGQSMLLFEQSMVPEGVTGNRDAQVQRTHITVEEASLSDDPLIMQAMTLWSASDRHFVAEFGLKDGLVYWLQLMFVGSQGVSMRDPSGEGYQVSALGQEMTRVDPWIFAKISALAPGVSYRIFGGRLYEKPTMTGPAWKTLASATPWRVLEHLSEALLKRIERGAKHRWQLNVMLYCALRISVLAVHKAASLQVTTGRLPAYLVLLPSPFTSKAALESLDLESIVYSDAGLQKLHCSVLVRERMRAALALILASLARQEHQVAPLVEPLLRIDHEVVVSGSRTVDGGALDWDAPEGLARLSNSSGSVLVRMSKPDLAVFSHQSAIGAIEVKGAVAFNSHFAQRCRAFGIALKANCI